MAKIETNRADESSVERIRDAYAGIAERRGIEKRASCCPDPGAPGAERMGYDPAEIRKLPEDADMGLGCGAPVPQLRLQLGEAVLDLGSGGGIDVFLAARHVGPSGRVIGVDMTPQMIDLARDNASKGGYANVEFRQGRLEALPVEDASVDAVTSNCVINLVPDKLAVFREIARVLRPGGRVVVSDIVLEREIPAAVRDHLTEGDCISTAMLRDDYMKIVRDAGLGEPEVLRDIDYLAALGWTDASQMDDESRSLLERAGVGFEEVAGTVRSVTFRAVKR